MQPHVIVLGGGESGRGVALLAQALGMSVRVSDFGELSGGGKAELAAAGVPYEEGGHSVDDIAHASLVVKSPGIPWEAPFVAFAKTRRIAVVGEMEFCARFAAERFAGAPRIGITGSNGKTTTTLLTGHLLAAAGLRVGVGGNVGTSYARLLLTPDAFDVYVLELSSYQLDEIRDFGVDIGMVLNLSPDHLDRYGDSFDAYAAAKYNLKRTQRPGGVWLQAADPLTLKHAPPAPDGVRELRMPRVFEAGHAITPTTVYPLTGPSLAGPHNAANASFALTAAEFALSRLGGTGARSADGGKSVDPEILASSSLPIQVPQVLAAALPAFRNAPHRLEPVGEVDGVTYINDSKATNLDAVDKALRSFEAPIVWICGGTDKGNDYGEIASLVAERVRAVVALGVDNGKLAAAFGDHAGGFRSVTSLKDAISSGRELAYPGDVVLLSPACASFDLFRDYIDRGDQFRAAVAALPDFEPVG